MFITNNNNILNSYNINQQKENINDYNHTDKYNDDKDKDNDNNDYITQNDMLIFKDNINNNIISLKIEKYEEYFNIFSDDLDGWSQ